MNSKYFLGTEKATNNTGELTAICEGLLWLKDYEKTNNPAAFYYDSKYASKITTGEYRPKNNKHLNNLFHHVHVTNCNEYHNPITVIKMM